MARPKRPAGSVSTRALNAASLMRNGRRTSTGGRQSTSGARAMPDCHVGLCRDPHFPRITRLFRLRRREPQLYCADPGDLRRHPRGRAGCSRSSRARGCTPCTRAVMVGLIGFLLAGGRGAMSIGKAISDDPDIHRGPRLVLLMALTCLNYVGVCIRSFIAARRRRKAAECACLTLPIHAATNARIWCHCCLSSSAPRARTRQFSARKDDYQSRAFCRSASTSHSAS